MNQPFQDERYIVQLDVFEGPLDLLLHLIRKHELDIFDIPISFITAKYLEYLDMMKELNLDLASDYLDMAATLALIKSKMMLPSEPVDDEDIPEEYRDPRAELVARLLEYQKYKTAALELADRPMLGRDTFPKGAVETIETERELAAPGLFSLMEAFQKMLKTADAEPTHEVSVDRISISDRINQLVDVLRLRPSISFSDLFEGERTRSEMVITFLSVLEMVKLGLSKVHQAQERSEIYITATSSMEEVEKLLAQNRTGWRLIQP